MRKDANRQLVAEWFGDDATTVVASADRVDLFRVDGMRGARAGWSGPTFAGYPVIDEVVHQVDPFVRQLAELLLDARHYDYDPRRGKGCLFSPGVGARFHSGSDTADALICFTCDDLAIFPANASRGPVRDFRPIRPALLALARLAFPHDADIRGLPDRRY